MASERSLRRFVLGAALVWIALVCAYFGLILVALRDGDGWDVIVLILGAGAGLGRLQPGLWLLGVVVVLPTLVHLTVALRKAS